MLPPEPEDAEGSCNIGERPGRSVCALPNVPVGATSIVTGKRTELRTKGASGGNNSQLSTIFKGGAEPTVYRDALNAAVDSFAVGPRTAPSSSAISNGLDSEMPC